VEIDFSLAVEVIKPSIKIFSMKHKNGFEIEKNIFIRKPYHPSVFVEVAS
jgi:hypothetical protein